MKTKDERAKIIKEQLDQLRSEVVVRNELQLRLLEIYESMEEGAIQENNDEAVERIAKFVREKKRKVYKIKATGKEYVVEDGEIVSTTPLK